MDMIHRVIEGVSFGISLIGIVVVLWGILEAVIAFLKSKLRGVGTSISMDPAMRQELSAHLLLGLEIFIAADIISSVASPTWEKVGILGAVVGIRTVLSYFLTMEMEKEKTMENGKWRMENSQSMHTLLLFATIY
jgi:uncharacterized membrane protein